MPKRRTKTGPYHHGDLKNALLEAAERLLDEIGPGGFSLRDVARTAGVSHTAPYRHFRDKAALLQALSGRGFERLRADVAGAAAGQRGPEQALIAAGQAYRGFAVQAPGMARLMFASTGAEADGGHAKISHAAVIDILTGIIRSGQQVGAFRNRDPGELALTTGSMLHGLALLSLNASSPVDTDNREALDGQVRSMIENLLYGISRL